MHPLEAVANDRLGVAATHVLLADASFSERAPLEAVAATAPDAVVAILATWTALAFILFASVEAFAVAETTDFIGRTRVPAHSTVFLVDLRVHASTIAAGSERIVRAATRAIATGVTLAAALVPVAAGAALGAAIIVAAHLALGAADGDFHRIVGIARVGIDDAEVARVIVAVALAANELAVFAVVRQNELLLAAAPAA